MGIRMNNWEKIWSSKKISLDLVESITLHDLIIANGFDTGSGDYSTVDWNVMIDDLISKFSINKNTKLLEVGCGSGALLYAIKNKTSCSVVGIDYSNELIKIAQAVMPDDNFIQCEAINIPSYIGSFDLIISHSVFQYFPNENYAESVITNLHKLLNPEGSLVLMDLNDKSKENFYHSERRMNYKNPEQYDSDYKNLPHLFFDKDKLTTFLNKKFINISYFRHASPNYKNSSFRFNLSCKKA